MKKIFKNGSFSSLYAAVSQGLHNGLLSLIYLCGVVVIATTKNQTLTAVVISAFVECFMFLFAIAFYTFKKFIDKKDKFPFMKFLRTKEGMWVLVSGLAGGALGSTSISLGISYGGSAYGSVLSSLFPIISMLIMFLIVKDKLNLYGLFGLLIVISSALCIALINTSTSDNFKNLFIGLMFGLLGGLFWAIEASIVSIVFMKSKLVVKDETLILVRDMASSLSLLTLIIPLTSILSNDHNIYTGYKTMFKITQEWNVLGMLVLIGFNLNISWLAYFNAIKHIGATKATSINITYVIWGPLFSIALSNINSNIETDISWSYWVFSITMIIGVVIMLYEAKIKSFIKYKRIKE